MVHQVYLEHVSDSRVDDGTGHLLVEGPRAREVSRDEPPSGLARLELDPYDHTTGRRPGIGVRAGVGGEDVRRRAVHGGPVADMGVAVMGVAVMGVAGVLTAGDLIAAVIVRAVIVRAAIVRAAIVRGAIVRGACVSGLLVVQLETRLALWLGVR